MMMMMMMMRGLMREVTSAESVLRRTVMILTMIGRSSTAAAILLHTMRLTQTTWNMTIQHLEKNTFVWLHLRNLFIAAILCWQTWYRIYSTNITSTLLRHNGYWCLTERGRHSHWHYHLMVGIEQQCAQGWDPDTDTVCVYPYMVCTMLWYPTPLLVCTQDHHLYIKISLLGNILFRNISTPRFHNIHMNNYRCILILVSYAITALLE